MAKELTKNYEYAWGKYSKNDLNELNKVNNNYKAFMSECKTERECD